MYFWRRTPSHYFLIYVKKTPSDIKQKPNFTASVLIWTLNKQFNLLSESNNL